MTINEIKYIVYAIDNGERQKIIFLFLPEHNVKKKSLKYFFLHPKRNPSFSFYVPAYYNK